MKQLPINWQDLELAFEIQSDEFEMECTHYFDTETGRVVFVDEEINSSANRVLEEFDDVLEEGSELTDELIRGSHEFQQLLEHEKPSVLAAITVAYGDASQYERIPHFDSHESYQDMQDFVETVNDAATHDRLSEAIGQRKPFRRFRDVLATDRRLQRQWTEFEHARQGETIMEWLQSIGIQPSNPETRTLNLPPLPDLRKIMFAEVRRFVRFARDIQGVHRIALIGSLTTDKEFPKDIDMLVTVSPDCDLTPLAQLSRQLSGHMNSHSAGADVFLASESGEYLGRTCPWRDCGPGYRTSCDAAHCGLRPYLHDDFNAIRLNEELIAEPPVLLWPILTDGRGLPADVCRELIEQLAKDEER